MREIPTKEPWLAVVLSSYWFGVGQIYAGRMLRGIILVTVELILILLLTWSWLTVKCDVLISIGLLMILGAISIWNLFDAHRCVRKTNSHDFETERKQNKDPWLALFLTDFMPGLGHLYLRKWLLDILFITTGALMLVLEHEYPLLYISLWACIATFISFHTYISTPVRREKSIRAILIVCAVILCGHLLDYNQYLFRAYVVEPFVIRTPDYINWIPPEQQMGPAMKPTLVYEDRVLVRKSRQYTPKRGDVVMFKSPENPKLPSIMRVAALPGEIIQMEDGILYVDSQKVNWGKTEFHNYGTGGYGIDEPYEVPEDCFFVLGDNIANSEDSRVFGAIHRSDLIGKAYRIYWPLSRRGPVE